MFSPRASLLPSQTTEGEISGEEGVDSGNGHLVHGVPGRRGARTRTHPSAHPGACGRASVLPDMLSGTETCVS